MTPARRLALLIGTTLLAVGTIPAAAGAQGWTRATANAGWTPRYAHASVVHDNKMWVMGGSDGQPRNDVWSSPDGTAWTRVAAAADWSARIGHQALEFDGKIFVFGGISGLEYKNDVYSSTDGSTWVKLTDHAAWSGRFYFASAVFNGRMWVTGGISSTARNADVWYSLNGIDWTRATAAAPWGPRVTPTLLSFENKLWLYSGDADVPPTDVWYSADGATWQTSSTFSPWVGRGLQTGAFYHGNAWLMGGITFPSVTPAPVQDVWTSPDLYSWEQQGTPPWDARGGHTSVVFNDRIWVLGGENGTDGAYNDVWSYSDAPACGCGGAKSLGTAGDYVALLFAAALLLLLDQYYRQAFR